MPSRRTYFLQDHRNLETPSYSLSIATTEEYLYTSYVKPEAYMTPSKVFVILYVQYNDRLTLFL